jgi:inosine-uridine nucleoside N-ribohydrolase
MITEKIILDTDIGSDVDDAACLAYLLAQPRCDLLGITTVTGEANKRAMMASALCKVADKKIPIYPGCEQPLLVAQAQLRAPQAAALARWDHEERFPRGQAIEFLRQTIRQHPGEITLLTIGPLTNVGLLFAVDREIPALLKRLVMMGGIFTNRLAGVGPREWNALGDPHATAIVYQSPVAIHRSLGLDVTCQVVMPAAEVRQRFQTGLLKPVLDFAEIWFAAKRENLTFHDPLAAVSIFDDAVCGYHRGMVDVELTSEKLQGLTFWKEDAAKGRHEVALDVNPNRFFEEYFSVFAA